VAAGVVALDQLTKAWAINALADGPIAIIDGTLQFRLARNTGAAFSLFASGGPIVGIMAIGVVILIFVALGDASRRLEAVALGLVLGGAVGNLLDRAFRGDDFLSGAVVDFVYTSFFPTFNVADTAITFGVALLLLSAFRRR
jgi:signal peptidase II